MVFTFRKDIQYLALWTGIIFLLAVPFYTAEIFSPGFSEGSVPYIGFAIFALIEGLFLVLLFPVLPKANPRWLCHRIARYEIAVNPIFSVFALYLAVTIPYGEHNWLYFVNMSLTAVLFALRMYIVFRLNRVLKSGQNGYIGIRNHSWIAASFLAVAFNFYVLSAIKMQGLDVSKIAQEGVAVITDLYTMITVIETLVVMIVLMQSMLMTVSTYYSAKEDTAFDFRTNLNMTVKLFVKYEVGFWMSIFATAILLVISIASAVRFFSAYISLVFLYASILIIRIPAFVQKKVVEKKYGHNTYPSFIRKHGILIYAAVLLIAYSIVCVIFANGTFSHVSEQIQGHAEYLTLGILAPWALIKIFLGIKTYQLARKTREPDHLLNAYIDILVAIYTIAKVFFILAGAIQIPWVQIADTVVGALITVYCVGVSIRMLVTGIRGSQGKRKGNFNENPDALDIIPDHIKNSAEYNIYNEDGTPKETKE